MRVELKFTSMQIKYVNSIFRMKTNIIRKRNPIPATNNYLFLLITYLRKFKLIHGFIKDEVLNFTSIIPGILLL